jgi:hypothetical protein
MKKFLKAAAFAAVASVAVYGSANAATSYAFQDGLASPLAGHTVLYNYDTLGNNLNLISGLTYSNAVIHNNTSDGVGAENPFSVPNNTNYLSVLAGGYVQVDFGTYLRGFSFDWGSRDTYNTLKVTLADNTVIPIVPLPGDGGQGSATTNGRFYFLATGGDSIKSIRFESTQNSFEVDNFSVGAAVPEPATWAMMITGFGLAGAAIRRRRTAFSVA